MYLDLIRELEEAEQRYKERCHERNKIYNECRELHNEIVRIYQAMSDCSSRR